MGNFYGRDLHFLVLIRTKFSPWTTPSRGTALTIAQLRILVAALYPQSNDRMNYYVFLGQLNRRRYGVAFARGKP